jgi:hypothetical protein
VDLFYPPGQTSNTSSANTGASDDVHNCSDNPPTINLTATDNKDGTYTIAAFVSAGTHPFNDSNYSQFPGTVTFSINGQTVKTSGVNDPQDNITFTYTPTASGTMTATVTDSVLYSASASADINFTAAAVGPQGFTAHRTGTSISFNWSGGTGPFTVYRNGSALGGTCSNTTTSNCSTTVANSSATYYVQDNSNNSKSSSVTE